MRIQAHVQALKKEDGFYGRCPDVKGIFIYCEMEAEIIPAIRESVEAYVEMSLKHGDPIPLAIMVSGEKIPDKKIPEEKIPGGEPQPAIATRSKPDKTAQEESLGVLANVVLDIAYA